MYNSPMINHSVFMTKFAKELNSIIDPAVEALARKAQKAKQGAKAYNLKVPKKWVGKGALLGIGAIGGAYAQDALTDMRAGAMMRKSQGF